MKVRGKSEGVIHVGLFFSFLVALITWATDAQAPLESLNPDPKNSYYNLLVQGFKAGQLNMLEDVPPGLAKLADPYDNLQNLEFLTQLRDVSYYKGKLYLYYGVTPAIVLYFPMALVGQNVSDRCAVAIFFGAGFFAMWLLLSDIRHRFFPEINFKVFAPGVLLLGLVLGLTQCGTVQDVPTVSAFTFAMIALFGIWVVLNNESAWALALASLSYGLAIGARPSLLFGAVILLIPAWQNRKASLLLPSIVPLLLVGIGLAVYNDLRFGSPFEFGRRYQLTGDYESTTAQQFSLHYFTFNFSYYFLQPFSLSVHFPFLKDVRLPALPAGYSAGLASSYGSIPFKYPFLIFALPLPWLLKRNSLGWLALVLLIVFVASAVINCLILTASSRYMLDFLPFLMLATFIGFLSLDQALPGCCIFIRIGWYLLLAYSLAFNSFANLKTLAFSDYVTGNALLQQNQLLDAIDRYQSALAIDSHVASYHSQLAIADLKASQPDAASSEAKTALTIDPNLTKAHYTYGTVLFDQGLTNEAYAQFEKALALDPNHRDFNFLFDNTENAWALATDPNPGKRNLPLAQKLVNAARQETGDKDPHTLVVASGVYALSGNYDQAIAIVQKAAVIASQAGQTDLVATCYALLPAYEQHKLFTP